MKIRYYILAIAIILSISSSLASSSSVSVRAPPAIGSSNSGEQIKAQATWSESMGGNGNTYQAIYVPGGITWDDANLAAVNRGGHLATIGGEAENSFVYGLIEIINPGDISGNPFWYEDNHGNFIGPWLGGYKMSGQWRWVTRDPWGYTNWAKGEPNNSNGIENRLIYFSYRTEEPTYCPPGSRCTADIHYSYSSGDYWNDFPNEQKTNGYIVEYEKHP